jgi:ABC-type branched-subunit amino acid transport system ATPase component
VDELTEGLAPVLVEAIGQAIRDLKETEQQTILLIEQNLPLALSLADHVYVMNKGAIVFEGAPDELSNAPDVQSTYLGV